MEIWKLKAQQISQICFYKNIINLKKHSNDIKKVNLNSIQQISERNSITFQ